MTTAILKPKYETFVNTELELGSEEEKELDMATVRAAAAWLRERTGLSIFGFDVVVELCDNGTTSNVGNGGGSPGRGGGGGRGLEKWQFY